MALVHFRMLIHGLLNKDTNIVPEEAPRIVLDSKSAIYMDKMVGTPSTQGTLQG